MLDYRGKLVLAPMVRVSELPIRKMALAHGADLVWGPEIVDKGLISSHRVVNDKLRTIDFLQNSDPTKLVWRTAPALEKSKVVFQLGSADPDLAVQAALMVARDVAAIDLNCGCPKHFSVHSGMGAQLLRTPDKLVDMLENLVEKVGKPHGIAVSAKIRILETAANTYELVSRLVKTGISCLTVHCRTTPMRPREPAVYDYLAEIANICHANDVMCYVNGDVRDRKHMNELMEKYNVDGAMIARAAQSNPLNCFSHEPTVEENEEQHTLRLCREFLDACVEYDFNKAHTKYNITAFVGGKSPLYAKFAWAKTRDDMEVVLAEAEKQAKEPKDPKDTKEPKQSKQPKEESKKRKVDAVELDVKKQRVDISV